MGHDLHLGTQLYPRPLRYVSPGRWVWVLLLRAVGGLVVPAMLLGFGFSGKLAAWIPHPTAFVVVFVCTGVALIIWMDMIARRWRRQERGRARHGV